MARALLAHLTALHFVPTPAFDLKKCEKMSPVVMAAWMPTDVVGVTVRTGASGDQDCRVRHGREYLGCCASLRDANLAPDRPR